MSNAETPNHHDANQGQASVEARHERRKLVIQVEQRTLWLVVAAAIVGGGVYLFFQYHRQPPASVSIPTPTVTPTPITLATPTPVVTPTALVASTPQSTPTASPSAHPASPAPAKDLFEDGMKRVLQAANSGFLELRGKLAKTENGTGQYALFRFRKIYEGTLIFGGATSAQLEEVYYSKPDQPAYNYQLFFQESLDKDSQYDDLRRRLVEMLQGFVHTSGEGYDAWVGSDAPETTVLLNSRDVPETVEVQVHVAFPKPRW